VRCAAVRLRQPTALPAWQRNKPRRRDSMFYLDANASEPLRPEAKLAMQAAFEVTGNPSSVHAAGRAARRILEDARERIAARFGVRDQDVVFTSNAACIAA